MCFTLLHREIIPVGCHLPPLGGMTADRQNPDRHMTYSQEEDMYNDFVIDIPDIVEEYGIKHTGALSGRSFDFVFEGRHCSAKYYGTLGKWKWKNWEDSSERGDAADLLILVAGMSKGEALSYLRQDRDGDLHDLPRKDYSQIITRSEQQKLVRDMENIRRLDKAADRDSLLSQALQARGIRLSQIPCDVLENMYAVQDCPILFASKYPNGKDFERSLTGLVFKTGLHAEFRKIRRFSMTDDGIADYANVPKNIKAMSFLKNHAFGLWSLEDAEKVFVTEGEPDCLSLLACGYPAFSIPGVACFETVIADLLKEGVLKKRHRLIIAGDADEPGRIFSEKLSALIRLTGAESRIVSEYGGYKDLNAWFTADPAGFESGVRKLYDTAFD